MVRHEPVSRHIRLFQHVGPRMKFIVRFFPEIIIKSRDVRQRHITILRRSLRTQLEKIDAAITVTGGWDSLEVTVPPAVREERVLQVLTHTPGIDLVLRVQQHPLQDLAHLVSLACAHYAAEVTGKRFVVRCKRVGTHAFTSMDLERRLGAALLQAAPGARVDLDHPEVTVRVDVHHDEVMLIERRIPGLGGYPLGTQDAVLSLISGGFDSTVSSYQCIKRGMLTHFCFFRLGGMEHEIAVKEVALYLWMTFGASHRVKFVTVPFEGVVEEIVSKVDNSQMGVVFKRMMMRAATRVAHTLKVEALVTGESVAQVASQTLANLAIIDQSSDILVLRPLITTDKREIIDIARHIGTEDFVKNVPEYCGVISVKPTTRARLPKIEREEAIFDESVLNAAIAQADYQMIDRVMEGVGRRMSSVPEHASASAESVIIDIRHPAEESLSPLSFEPEMSPVIKIPFYELRTRFGDLPRDKHYLLYCDKGFMSRLHASHLMEAGHANVAVYHNS